LNQITNGVERVNQTTNGVKPVNQTTRVKLNNQITDGLKSIDQTVEGVKAHYSNHCKGKNSLIKSLKWFKPLG